MQNLSHLLLSAPRGHQILFSRIVILGLSAAGLGLFATSLSIYNTSIAGRDSVAPVNEGIRIVTALSITATTISILWSIFHLALLARRMLHAYRRHSRGLATAGGGDEAWDEQRPLVHPGWEIVIDLLCWALLLVATVLVGTEWNRWKRGNLSNGLRGTNQVDLAACPTFDPATGMLNYWCGHAWNSLLFSMFNGQNVMAPTAYVHLLSILNQAHVSTNLLSHPTAECTLSSSPTHALLCPGSVGAAGAITRRKLKQIAGTRRRKSRSVPLLTKHEKSSWSGRRGEGLF